MANRIDYVDCTDICRFTDQGTNSKSVDQARLLIFETIEPLKKYVKPAETRIVSARLILTLISVL